jgi:hypothetical protein
MIKPVGVALIATALAAMSGCKHPDPPYQFMLADFLAARELPYDSPPQVIYRLDDHRYVTLERYRDCYHGETYYNDTQANIRQPLGRAGIEDYQGKLVNADPTGRNLVFPSGAPPHMASIDRGWGVELLYSTDGGKTFHSMEYMPHSFDPFEDSKEYIVIATGSKLYVARRYQFREDMSYYDLMVDAYLLDSHVDLNKPYPPGFSSDGAWASKKQLIPHDLKILSADDHIHCDDSIKPTNADAPLTKDLQ